MEEFADSEETSYPVVHRTAIARHHGMRDDHVQVLGATRRVQHHHQIRTVQHIGTGFDFGLQTRVRAAPVFIKYYCRQ